MTPTETAAQLCLAADWIEKNIPEQPKPLTLPTPPPGMKWHREDGWTAEMLPPRTRPLVENEVVHAGDEFWHSGKGPWTKTETLELWNMPGCPIASASFPFRTTRPLLFTHEGHEWTWHRAGDPMPCDGEQMVNYLMKVDWPSAAWIAVTANSLVWGNSQDPRHEIIGWRYADAPLPIQTFAQDQVELTSEMQEAVSQVLKEEMQGLDPYADLKKAHVEGKVIETKWSTFKKRVLNKSPDWTLPVEQYRIKPDEIPWIEWHGGECPVNDEEVEEWEVKYRYGGIAQTTVLPSDIIWKHINSGGDIIAYRVLKWSKKMQLGPEDVPPQSVLLSSSAGANGTRWTQVLCVKAAGVEINGRACIPWTELKTHWQINRSIPLTGKWDPNAWEACEK